MGAGRGQPGKRGATAWINASGTRRPWTGLDSRSTYRQAVKKLPCRRVPHLQEEVVDCSDNRRIKAIPSNHCHLQFGHFVFPRSQAVPEGNEHV